MITKHDLKVTDDHRHGQIILTRIRTDPTGRRHSTSVSLNHKTQEDLNISEDCFQVEIQQNKDPKRRGRRHSMQEHTSRTRSPPRKMPRTPDKMSNTKGQCPNRCLLPWSCLFSGKTLYQFLDLAVAN